MIRVTQFWSKLLKQFQDERVRFRLVTCLKYALMPFLSLMVLYFFLWIMIDLNLIFFEMDGNFSGELKEAYYEKILFEAASDFALAYAIILIVISLVGLYVGNLIMRPFNLLGNFCEAETLGEQTHYDPGYLIDLKLMTRFSEFFFLMIKNMVKNKTKLEVEIPIRYTRIHKPVFETNFFIQVLLINMVLFLVSGFVFYKISADVYEQIVTLSSQVLKLDTTKVFLLQQQYKIFERLIFFVIFFNLFSYIMLSFNLYRAVSAPAFAFFSTLRSFLKGSYGTRVHLIGFYYLREDGRKLNKYLSHLEHSFNHTQEKNRERS
jgi:hypothetical protein